MKGREGRRVRGGQARLQRPLRRWSTIHRRRQHAVHPERGRQARPRRTGRQGRDCAFRQPPVQRRCRLRPVEHPPMAVREGLHRLHHQTAHRNLLPHRHQHVHLDSVEQKARRPQGHDPAHRRFRQARPVEAEPGKQTVRNQRRADRLDHPHLHRRARPR